MGYLNHTSVGPLPTTLDATLADEPLPLVFANTVQQEMQILWLDVVTDLQLQAEFEASIHFFREV